MSDDLKKNKEELLRQMLSANMELGMKEANASIRDQFDTGVSPPIFSKIKKELEDELAQGAKPAAKKVAEKKAPKAVSSEEKPEKPVKIAKAKKEEVKTPKAKKIKEDVAEQAVPIIDEFLNSPVVVVKEAPVLHDLFDGQEAQKARVVAPSENGKAPLSDEDNGDQGAEMDMDGSDSSIDSDNAPEQDLREEEPEIDPNLPKFPIRLEIQTPEATEVHLSGSFNRWRVGENPLQKESDNIWVFDGELPEGEHHYKFVLDRKIWFLDMHRERVLDKTGVSHKLTVSKESVS